MHLQSLGEASADPGTAPDLTEMADWVTETLANDRCLYRDKIRGDGTIDAALWSYNQGSMLGLHALLADQGGPDGAAHLRRAEVIAQTALNHYERRHYEGEPVEFVAIFIRNLLVLCARTREPGLAERITETLRARAAAAWPIAAGATLLAHSASVSLQALAAWDPADLHLLA